MPKVIGILGGISPASTLRYYQRIVERYYQRQRDYHYPEIALYSLDFQRFTDLENSADKAGYIEEIVRGIRCLERCGADLALMAANSPHSVFKEVESRVEIPLISIVEITAKKARDLKLGRLLLLGIQLTMQSDFYRDAFQVYGMEVISPSSSHQDEIEAMIFDELVLNIIREETRDRLMEIIRGYPVDGVILGCTELPLILHQDLFPFPVLDTLDLHVEAALDDALGEHQ
jgi:aspartate racemase